MVSLTHLRWIPGYSISGSTKTTAALSWSWLLNRWETVIFRCLTIALLILRLCTVVILRRRLMSNMGHLWLLLIWTLLMRMTSHLVLLSCTLISARISLNCLFCKSSWCLNNSVHWVWHALELHLVMLVVVVLVIWHLDYLLVMLMAIIVTVMVIILLVQILTLCHLFLLFLLSLFSCPLLLFF